MPIFHGAGGAGDSTNDAVVTEVANYASQAATSATNAATSATNSSTSASSASTSASNAAASASQAATSANNAASSVVAAQAQVSTATTKANEAAASAVTAATQASNSATSATAAANSADLADASASDAAASAAAALASAEDASDAVTDALSLYGDAQALADAVDDAETAATNAASSASAASGFATTATNAASTATTQATAANNSAISASSSAAAASTQAGNAATSANSAAESAADALDSYNDTVAIYGSTAAVEAAVSNSQANRDAAAASATAASNSASASATSATASATSASAAATSAAQASAVALGNEPVRHSVRPSLLLDFANTKTLDPRITFTRGSTATFYDGKTVAKAEENLIVRSQEFDNAVWIKSNVTVTANSATAPDGTTTADRLTATASNGEVYQGISIATGAERTSSIWIRRVTGTGTISLYAATTPTDITAQVTSNWSRVSLTSTAGSSTIYSGIRLGTSGDVVEIWGAQIELRSSVTAYTPTTTAPITNYIPALQTAGNNVPRFEHNPVTGESLGLEIEEQRTNLVVRSEEFNTASWTKTRASIQSNVIVAPDGTLTGDKLVEDTTASNLHYVEQPIAASTSAHTFSVFMKAGERNWAVLRAVNSLSANVRAWFNLANGTVGVIQAGGGAGITSSIVPVGNGWYRCTLVLGSANASAFEYRVELATADSFSSYTGNGYSGIYIWGAQLEAGSFATSYIPTVASQVTRSADSASMTGTNFSSWYRADEGTLYSDAVSVAVASSAAVGVASLNDGSGNNRVDLRLQSGGTSFVSFVSSGGTNYAQINNSGSYAPNTVYKSSIVYALNDFARANNAGTVVTDTSGILPINVNRLVIGAVDAGTGGQLNGTIKKIAYYAKRLTNSEIQSLTTV